MPGNVSDVFSLPRKPKRYRVSIFCCGRNYAQPGTQTDLIATDSSVHEQERDATPNLPLMETQTTPGDVPLPETEPDTPNLPLIETQTTASDVPLPETEPSEKTPIKHKFYVYVSKKMMKQLESEAKIGRSLLLKTKQKKYIASLHAKSLMAVMIVHVPKVSLDALQYVISFLTVCLLHDLGVPVLSVP